MADKFQEALYYNPHIWWDPIGPVYERELDEAAQRQLAQVRLSLYRDVLQAQLKAADGALAVISKAER